MNVSKNEKRKNSLKGKERQKKKLIRVMTGKLQKIKTEREKHLSDQEKIIFELTYQWLKCETTYI